MTKYRGVLTRVGTEKLAKASANGQTLELSQMALGDGEGSLPTPNAAQTALVRQVYRAELNRLTVDSNNANQLIAELVIPENIGGWWIREIGLFDKQGALIAVANCAETYKPKLEDGSGRSQIIRMLLVVSSTEAVTLKIDPAVVLAPRSYVDERLQPYLRTADINQYIPVGLPLPWPQATPPAGWFKCNGASFDKAKYPLLAAAYPSGKLPDLRGEFIRGWDDARGVDKGRGLLSWQGDAFKEHHHTVSTADVININAFIINDKSGDRIVSSDNAWQGENGNSIYRDNRYFTNNSGGNETRPRNIAFNYIVRAA